MPVIAYPGPLPSILIDFDVATGVWNATAILLLEQRGPIGPSTMSGSTPAEALQELLARRFMILVDSDCPATIVSIEPIPDGAL